MIFISHYKVNDFFQNGIAQSVERQDSLLKVIGAKPITVPNKIYINIETMKYPTPKTTAEKPALAQLRELGAGESCTFPAERSSYIKSICSQFGFEWGRKFTSRTDRETRTVTVTRIQ